MSFRNYLLCIWNEAPTEEPLFFFSLAIVNFFATWVGRYNIGKTASGELKPYRDNLHTPKEQFIWLCALIPVSVLAVGGVTGQYFELVTVTQLLTYAGIILPHYNTYSFFWKKSKLRSKRTMVWWLNEAISSILFVTSVILIFMVVWIS